MKIAHQTAPNNWRVTEGNKGWYVTHDGTALQPWTIRTIRATRLISPTGPTGKAVIQAIWVAWGPGH